MKQILVLAAIIPAFAALMSPQPSVAQEPGIVFDASFATLPTGWAGIAEDAENLPEGSQGAVKCAKKPDGGSDNIKSEQKWVPGLFAVAPDLHFNFRVRTAMPDWFLVFLCIKQPGVSGPVTNYMARAGAKGDPTDWRIVSIPFSEFAPAANKQAGDLPSDASKVEGAVVAQFFFDFQGRDLGFSVDRVWVTKGGPATSVPK